MTLIIVSFNARPWASAARTAGFQVHAIDLFADSDTRESALSAQRIGAVAIDGAMTFDGDELAEAITRCDPGADYPIAVGSGFDAAPRQLADLARERCVLGANLAALERCTCPKQFSAMLRDLAVAFPMTRVTPPRTGGRWLRKRAAGSGGWHVHEVERTGAQIAANAVPRDAYYQRYVRGRSISLTVLTSRGNALVIGYADQSPGHPPGSGRYTFAGAKTLRAGELRDAVREQMHAAAIKLSRALALDGLVSLDFIVNDEQCHLVELNPRLSATAELHDDNGALFNAHVRACSGDDALMQTRMQQARYLEPKTLYGCEIVFAPDDISVCAPRRWPQWLRDRPAHASLIKKGNPLCSVYARHEDGAALAGLLAQRGQRALHALMKRNPKRR